MLDAIFGWRGSHGGNSDAILTIIMDPCLFCRSCRGKIVQCLTEVQGIESVKMGGEGMKQLTVVRKIGQQKLRKDKIYNKAWTITAVLELNLTCGGCTKSAQKIVASTKGFQSITVQKDREGNDKSITVKGILNLKALVDKLERKLRRHINIATLTIECDLDNSGSRGNWPFSTPDCCCWGVEQILKDFSELFV